MRTCKDCGAEIQGAKRQYCDACRTQREKDTAKRYNQQYKGVKQRQRREAVKRAKTGSMTLSEAARQARDMGLTYGQYMALRAKEKPED